jgi:Restriction endonuclease
METRTAEGTLRRLLDDSLVPGNVLEKALMHILDAWASKDGDALQLVWQELAGHQDLLLCGPTPNISTRTTRVARILSLNNFVDYYLRAQLAPPHKVDDHSLDGLVDYHDREISIQQMWQGRLPLVWVTLAEELLDSPAETIRTNLGLFRPEYDDLVCITYDVPTQMLRVPTVIDAGIDPWVVAKDFSSSGKSRSWNWQEGLWGATELVHARLEGLPSASVRRLPTSPATYAPPHFRGYLFDFEPGILATGVSQLIAQIAAHINLEPFLSRQNAVLELTAIEFERFVALYARRGYATHLTQATRDGGFDVVAIRDEESGEGLLIQAKKTKGVVGISVIRELIGARFLAPSPYKNHVLVVATTGTFSKPARDAETMFASEFELRDFDSLQEELEHYRLLGVRDIVQEAMQLRGKSPATGR